jgi:membrane protease YdiL (CAAX protease family)
MGSRFVALAAVFYAALLFAAVLLGIFFYRLSPALRRLSDELAPQLVDGARWRDLVLISVFSGVGEESFFRGALQPELGLVATSLLFGVLHIGPDRRYFVWTGWAVGAGFLFGALYQWTGGILAPITAHVLHNAATLLLWKWSRSMRSGTLGDTVPAGDAAARRTG